MNIRNYGLLDELSHYAIIGIGAGVVRVGCETINAALAIIKTLGSLCINRSNSSYEAKQILYALAGIGRGLLEIIPVYGRVAAIFIDQKKFVNAATQLAEKGDIEEAVKIIEAIPGQWIDIGGGFGLQSISISTVMEELENKNLHDKAEELRRHPTVDMWFSF